ncbi:MAG: tyrosine-type recombinase/integrase [Rhodospirillaceae bacterium]|nr:tyrosine-type recombinase/integrase [Rhodospirillaceae bacterium]
MTEPWVRNLKPTGPGRVDWFDTTKPGLVLRLSETGAKSWAAMYRLDGKLVRDTIGKFPKVTLAAARDAAGARLEAADRGEDPRQAEARRLALEAKRRSDTFEALAKQYQKAKLAKLRSGDELWAALERDLMPTWRSTPIRDLTRATIMERLDEIEADYGPYARNRRAALLSAMFNFGIDRGLAESNPAARIEKLGEVERDRVLSDSEIVEIWHAAGKLTQPLGPLIRLLILTGQRRSEIGDMEWTELDKAGGLLAVRADRMKGKIAHEVPLPPAAMALFDDLPAYAEPKTYVFASLRRKDAPVNAFSQVKAELDRHILEARLERDPKAQPMPHWVFHDLRRSMRSGLSRLRIPRDIAERVIAHTPGGVEKVYDRFEFRDEKRNAISTWCNHVAALLDPGAGKVADISDARKRAKK